MGSPHPSQNVTAGAGSYWYYQNDSGPYRMHSIGIQSSEACRYKYMEPKFAWELCTLPLYVPYSWIFWLWITLMLVPTSMCDSHVSGHFLSLTSFRGGCRNVTPCGLYNWGFLILLKFNLLFWSRGSEVSEVTGCMLESQCATLSKCRFSLFFISTFTSSFIFTVSYLLILLNMWCEVPCYFHNWEKNISMTW